MTCVEWIEHNGAKILYADFRWAETVSEMIQILEEQIEEMATADGNVRLLADFRNTYVDDVFLERASQYNRETKTEKSAILDLSGMKRALLLQNCNLFSGTDLELFDSEDEAKDYLSM